MALVVQSASSVAAPRSRGAGWRHAVPYPPPIPLRRGDDRSMRSVGRAADERHRSGHVLRRSSDRSRRSEERQRRDWGRNSFRHPAAAWTGPVDLRLQSRWARQSAVVRDPSQKATAHRVDGGVCESPSPGKPGHTLPARQEGAYHENRRYLERRLLGSHQAAR
jgi:hypothetical protein